MKFELKSVVTVGAISSNEDNTMTQHLNIVIGIEDCPYDDIKTEKTIKYIFNDTTSAIDIKNGIEPFAKKWVLDNYPNTK